MQVDELKINKICFDNRGAVNNANFEIINRTKMFKRLGRSRVPTCINYNYFFFVVEQLVFNIKSTLVAIKFWTKCVEHTLYCRVYWEIFLDGYKIRTLTEIMGNRKK